MRDEVLIFDGLQRCPYLPGRVARMPLLLQRRRLSPQATDASLALAERRAGGALYHTACPTCQACKGIRVLVDEFAPSKSQRRVAARWETLPWRVETGPVRVDEARLDLYNRHKRERGLTGEEDTEMDAAGYEAWLARSCLHTIEMAYYLDDRLVGVGVVDLGARAASSVYFYFDPSPEIAALSPGVFSVLQEVELCRRTGRRWLYLGLWVADCAQLAYKAQYLPHERLEDGDWRRHPARRAANG